MAAGQEQPTRAGQKHADAPVLKLKVRGPAIRLGRIAVPDLIGICQGVQSAIHRQAKALGGSSIKQCTLELIAINQGFTTLEFGLAKPPLPVPVVDFDKFGSTVIRELACK